jgi:CRISPR-associated protein Cas2
MLHVVSYDIIDDKVRNRVSECLLGFGTRIQDSVFECLMDDELRDRLVEELGKIELNEQDRIRIYQVCARCVDQVQIYGPGEVTTNPDFYLV